MFLKQLQQPSIHVVLISLLVSALLWFAPLLFQSADEIEMCNLLFLNQYTLWVLPMWMARLVAFVVVFLLMLWLNTLCEQFQILPSRSMVPFVLGILLMSVVDYVQILNAQLVAFVFFFLALVQVFGVLHSSNSSFAAFNSVILTLIASLFQPQYIWFILLIVLSLFFFRAFTARALVSILIALLAFVFTVFSISWLLQSTDLLLIYLQQITDFSFPWSSEFNPYQMLYRSDFILIILLLLLSIFSLFYYFSFSTSCKLNVRLNFEFINWSSWLILIWLLFFTMISTQLLLPFLLFEVLCISFYFSTNFGRVANIIFLVTLLILLAYRVLWIFGY
ncbi:MAG: hypothetical protein R3Y59_09525 [bacterium]